MTDQSDAPIVLPPKTDRRIFDPMEHVTDEEISPLDHILYADQDVDLLVWWADPGESHLDIHKHPHSAHVYFIVQGEGEALLGNGVWEPVRAGNVIVNPREKVHALRNTMASGRLVWASATTEAAGDYIMVPGTEDED